jgi:hypothetical protein
MTMTARFIGCAWFHRSITPAMAAVPARRLHLIAPRRA